MILTPFTRRPSLGLAGGLTATALVLAFAMPPLGAALAGVLSPPAGEVVPAPRQMDAQTDGVHSGTPMPVALRSDLPEGGLPQARPQAVRVGPVNTASLKAGLDALGRKEAGKALAARDAMPARSLERKLLTWAIAMSGQPGIPSTQIAAMAGELSDWPGATAIRRNSEAALAREGHDPRTITGAFAQRKPESLEGAILLARSWQQLGNARAANAAIAPIWREWRLSEAEEKRILNAVGSVLTRDDHRARMHMHFYAGRASDGLRNAGRAELSSLGRAWAAVIRGAGNADVLLDAVSADSRGEPGYLFARIRQARRADDYKAAAALLAKAPKSRAALGDPDAWWEHRRAVARGLLDLNDARNAYAVAAGHHAESPADFADGEFHAGWIAHSFLNDRGRAKRHFQAMLKVAKTPMTASRAHYWLARASGAGEADTHFRNAARYTGTFYGQLAAAKRGQRALPFSQPKPSPEERARFGNRELVRALAALEDVGSAWRADLLYRHLAETIDSAGELALLAARAEKQGDHTLALQIGKIAHGRGLEVDSVSWPVGAIPASARTDEAGKALAYAIARQESAFNVGAVSRADARGLLQLLPGTAKMMAKRTGLPYSKERLTTDPGYNVSLGAAYLSQQLDSFDNSYILTFAGYNAGPGRARQWVERFGDPRGKPIDQVVDWIERIPFTETRNYVMRVMENYQVYKARLGAGAFDIERDLRYGRR